MFSSFSSLKHGARFYYGAQNVKFLIFIIIYLDYESKLCK